MDRAQPGHTVKFTGLIGAAHLNGTLGTLVRYNRNLQRWAVRCDGNDNMVNAKPENLELQNNQARRNTTGEIDFRTEPPQSYIFCGRCDDHFMVCACTGTGHGIDYIFKNLPAPLPGASRIELMRRFASICAVSPAMRHFDARSWHTNEAPGIASSISARETQLRQMMEDYIATLSTSNMLAGLISAVGGEPLIGKSHSVQVTTIANECRAAMSIFISGDWSTMTRVGCVLINNAFQASDPTRYRLDDEHLMTIFGGGIECLMALLNMAYSDYGWRLALECDRAPVGTDVPVQTATDRDYFLQNVNR